MGERNPTAFGRNLRRIRKRRGLSQFELADLSGVSRSVIAVLESGQRQSVITRTLDRLADALKCSAADFYREESTPKTA